MSAISDRLKDERRRLKMSQEEMARVGGVARSAQGNYERGERCPDTNYLAALSYEGVDVAYVITGVRAANSAKSFDSRSFAIAEKFQKLEEFDRQCVERLIFALEKF